MKQTKRILTIWLTVQSFLTFGQSTPADSAIFVSSERATRSSAASPYVLRITRDVIIGGVGLATGLTALVLESQTPIVTAEEVRLLNAQTLNQFDRSAVDQYSTTADRLSDVTLAGNAALLGAITLVAKPLRQDVTTVAVMYVETLLLANGIQRSIKNVTQRLRPYAYNPGVPLSEKLDRSTRQSFFSGHATNAFATAVFTAEVFRHYFPESTLKPVVWAGALGLATATAVFRYEAGMHYPTDLLAGAAFGSLVGWGIPKLHQVKRRSAQGRRIDVQPWSNGETSGLYVRLLLFSR